VRLCNIARTWFGGLGSSLVLAAALLGEPQNAAGKDRKLLSKEAVFNKAAKATVLIVVPNRGKAMIGTGVIIESKGVLLTNAHVVELAGETVQVFLYNPKEKILANELSEYVKTHTPLVGTIKTRNRVLDLALITLPEQKAAFPTVGLADKEALKVGQDVVAIGNPLGLTWTFTSGTISSLREDMIQTETPINRGNSGGPLLDMQARLVGINTRIRRDNEQSAIFGFAIPVRVAQDFVKTWKKRQTEPPIPSLPLQKNPVPLLSMVLRQDLDKLRQLNGRRGNSRAEQAIESDLSACEKLGRAALTDELTVGQVIPQLEQAFRGMKQHNEGAGDPAEWKIQAHTQRALLHLSQIADVSR